MLVDGQQRVATLMLLVAALRDTLGNSDGRLPAAPQGAAASNTCGADETQAPPGGCGRAGQHRGPRKRKRPNG
jgi:hypothetical protein